MIPYSKQEILPQDIQAVIEVLQSPLITQGPKVVEFEEQVASKVQAKYANAFNSATSALHCAALALGLGKNDWLWSTPLSFVASSNCAFFCGARVDFVDVDSRTYNLDVDLLEQKLKKTKKSKLPKVLVAVHFAGQSCQMRKIWNLAQTYGFKVIEDASHALGGMYEQYPIGSCVMSDITIFSFHPVKIITSAEGGMALTNNAKYHAKMAMLKNHGIARENFEHKSEGGWYYEQQILGFNYRLNEIQAALGLSQLARLDQYVQKRNELAQYYSRALSGLELVLPYVESYNKSAFHLYPILLKKESKIKRKKLFEKLRGANIGVQVHYIPIHWHPFYARYGFKRGDFKVAEWYYKKSLSIPLYPSLSQQEQDEVIALLYEWVGHV